MIVVENLSFTFPGAPSPTLESLDFEIADGEILGFLGPSGAGKSTTQRILIGLLEGYGGRAEVLGKEVRDWGPEFYESIGVSFELPNHHQRLTALENLQHFGALYQGPLVDPLEVLRWVDLEAHADKRVSDFSKGMKIRLNVARSLLHRPKLLFLDEPTSGLDPVNAKRIKDLVRRLQSEGTTVFVTRTKCAHGLRSSAKLHPGVLIVVQRFRSDLGLYVHLHALVTDGCFETPPMPNEAVVFRPAAGLCEQDLLRTLQRLHGDLGEHLEDGDSEPVDEALVACVQLGLPLRAVGPSPSESRPASPMLVRGFGMQLHAAVTVDGRDRKRLERVCRYLLRPPFALDAVQRTADGQVRVHFKKPNRFGATYAQMSPHTFLARLCALVPPPRAHTVLYYGVLSAHHGLRSAVVPRAEEPAPEAKQLALFVPRGHVELPATTTLLEAQLRDAAPPRLPWMTLLARVFRIDISVCARCSGPMKVTRFVTTPEDIAAVLHAARPPPRRPTAGQLLLFSAPP